MVRRLLLLAAALAGVAAAHIGSPDIYLDAAAGPYRFFVTIRTPAVIPGVAELEVRAAQPGISALSAVPLPLAGPGAKFAPIADKLTRSPADPQLFTGSLWMMTPGSWQVRLTVEGDRGHTSFAIPLPAAATATKRMRPGLGILLGFLGLLLVAGLIAMVGAGIREARLSPGIAPDARRIRAGYVGMSLAAAVLGVVLWSANRWWNNEANSYAEEVYRPLRMRASIGPSQLLTLRLNDPGWLSGPEWNVLFRRTTDDFIPDHGHLMHLYAIRQPGLDIVYHLHPALAGTGVFQMELPSMPAGSYRLYADVVHSNGFPETLVSALTLETPVKGRSLGLDEATGSGRAWQNASENTREFTLPDGDRMLWEQPQPATVLKARQPFLLSFRLVRPDGTTPPDMALYMGMLGHAAFIKSDGTVFAHVHPSGTVPMAALMLAEKNNTSEAETPGADMSGMDMAGMGNAAAPQISKLPNIVSFPYGFPSAGRYRIFVQMKQGETVETGIFDTRVN